MMVIILEHTSVGFCSGPSSCKMVRYEVQNPEEGTDETFAYLLIEHATTPMHMQQLNAETRRQTRG